MLKEKFNARMDGHTHGRTTDNRPWHNLAGLRPVELKKTSQGKFLPSLVQIGPEVWEKKMFKGIVDDARRPTDDERRTQDHFKSYPWARCAQVS